MKGGEVITYPKSHDILGGITRLSLLDLVNSDRHQADRTQPSRSTEALAADEAFLTSSSAFVAARHQDRRQAGRQRQARSRSPRNCARSMSTTSIAKSRPPHDQVRPTVLLFDWDNTLVDSWSVIHAAMNETLEAHGPSALVALRGRGPHPRLACATASRSSSAIALARGREGLLRRLRAPFTCWQLEPLPGAADLLAWASGAGFYLGVVSNKRGHYLRKEAAHLGWDKYFAALAGAGDAAQDKPRPRACPDGPRSRQAGARPPCLVHRRHRYRPHLRP